MLQPILLSWEIILMNCAEKLSEAGNTNTPSFFLIEGFHFLYNEGLVYADYNKCFKSTWPYE